MCIADVSVLVAPFFLFCELSNRNNKNEQPTPDRTIIGFTVSQYNIVYTKHESESACCGSDS